METKKHQRGKPQTFEALVLDYIRKDGMTPVQAVRAATASDGRLQADYYERLRVSTAANMNFVLEGNPL